MIRSVAIILAFVSWKITAIDLNTNGCSEGYLQNLVFNISYLQFDPVTNKTRTAFATYDWNTPNTKISRATFSCSSQGPFGWRSRTASTELKFEADSLKLEWYLQPFSIFRKNRSIVLNSVEYTYELDEARFPLSNETAVFCIGEIIANAGPVGEYVYEEKGAVWANLTSQNMWPRFQVEYLANNKTNETGEDEWVPMTVDIIPNNLTNVNRTVTGEHTDDSVTLIVTWSANADQKSVTDLVWRVTMMKKDGKAMITKMNVNIPVWPIFGFDPKAKKEGSVIEADFGGFISGDQKWDMDGDFMCAAKIEKTDAKVNTTVMIENFQITAFNSSGNGNSTECIEDGPKTTTTTPTTPKPQTTTTTPLPDRWAVPKSGEKHCIFFQAESINITLTYRNATALKNETDAWIKTEVVVPKSASVGDASTCNWEKEDLTDIDLLDDSNKNNDTDQILHLEWTDKKMKRELEFRFAKSADGSKFTCSNVTFSGKFPDSDGIVTVSDNALPSGFLAGEVGHAITCSEYGATQKPVNETAGFEITVVKPQVQAYGNGSEISKAESCPVDTKTSDLIPIIVGACLAALVVIVLVAYLIGRARARRTEGSFNEKPHISSLLFVMS